VAAISSAPSAPGRRGQPLPLEALRVHGQAAPGQRQPPVGRPAPAGGQHPAGPEGAQGHAGLHARRGQGRVRAVRVGDRADDRDHAAVGGVLEVGDDAGPAPHGHDAGAEPGVLLPPDPQLAVGGAPHELLRDRAGRRGDGVGPDQQLVGQPGQPLRVEAGVRRAVALQVVGQFVQDGGGPGQPGLGARRRAAGDGGGEAVRDPSHPELEQVGDDLLDVAEQAGRRRGRPVARGDHAAGEIRVELPERPHGQGNVTARRVVAAGADRVAVVAGTRNRTVTPGMSSRATGLADRTPATQAGDGENLGRPTDNGTSRPEGADRDPVSG
jgi:hypothetical protein